MLRYLKGILLTCVSATISILLVAFIAWLLGFGLVESWGEFIYLVVAITLMALLLGPEGVFGKRLFKWGKDKD